VITIHGWDIGWAMLIDGLGQGLAYAVLAAGIVLIYRASGVINFAQGALGVFGLTLMAVLIGIVELPFLIGLPLAVVGSALVGGLAEFLFIRRLFTAPRLVLLVATIGISQLILFGALSMPDLAVGGPFPTLVPWSVDVTSSITISASQLSVFIAAPALIIGLGLFLTYTRAGLMIRASASNSDKSRLNGIRVRRASTMVWAIAGAFAGMTAIVLAPFQNLSVSAATQVATQGGGYELLLRALVVCLIARMRSLPLTIVGGLAVGVTEVVVYGNVDATDFTAVYLVLLVATGALVFTFRRSSRAASDDESWSLAPKVKALPENVQSVWWMRNLPRMSLGGIIAFLALVPVIFGSPSQLFSWSRVVIYAIVGCSLTVLTGWGGQLSLGQFGFAAVGGLTTLTLVQGNEIPMPFGLGTDVHYHAPWGVAVLIGVLLGAAIAVLVGLPALRIPGLFLAIITLAFAVFMGQYVLSRTIFVVQDSYATGIPKPVVGPLDFSSRTSYFYLCLGALVITLVLVSQLRRTGIGRGIMAVRTNERAAAAQTINPMRMKLLAFGLSGALAALAGGLLVTLLITPDPTGTFGPEESILVVAIVVIGGLGSIAGPVLGALWIVGVPAVAGGSATTNLFVSGVGLLALLLYFPGGFVQLGYLVRDALARYVSERIPAREGPQRAAEAAVPKRVDVKQHDVGELELWLQTTDIRVNFGGRVAVDGVSIHIAPREFVGLIGTNGAGKSTLMNAISGFVPCTGSVEILGKDVSDLSAPRRHRLGLGRGFQAARLYDDLTVRETILVALEATERSLFLPSLFDVPPSPASERRKRAEAGEIIAYLGLGRYADEFVSTLSTGTRRITELACLLAVGPRVVLLDEPTGGLAQRETEAFGPLIKQIQRELDAAVLLIEHDMPLVMSISDRVYCLEVGAVIAEGPPEIVRHDPRVIASYLGTDERTIARSNAGLALEGS
jgi:ABC-type branched-subunit amino acid transport system ATPase component/ABC-type branched-subunit amino acid transport system permease subunit